METLAERIAREGPVNELDAVGWIVRLAKKLESLHGRGLAHGGVCPAAMKTASASRLSLGMLIPVGGINNGLDFRSPERMDTEATSATDDTWATAVTLYALITGSSPFVAPDHDSILMKIRSGSFTPLSSFDVGDDDLQHILDAALNPSLAHRTSSLSAFREALEGWHPDSKVRELPPMVDDQPEDDDDDARTVMRPVSAADAVRALIAQREQAAVAARASEAPPAAKEIASSAKESASAARPGAAATNHGLLEDDDENAKTSMISVPPMAMLAKLAPATVPAPPPKDMLKSAPPPTSNPPTGFGMMRSGAGAAAKAPAVAGRPGAKATIAGGFTAKALMEQANRPAPPVASTPGISREAVLDEGDNDATVMREAPVEVMRQAKPSIAPPVADRKTPVDPTSAAVAAATAAHSNAPPAETSVSFASVSMIEEVPDKPSALETPAKPATASQFGQTPAAAAKSPPVSALADLPPAGSAVPIPQNLGLPPGSAFSALAAPSTPGMAAPAPVTPAPAPLAQAPAAQPPVVAPNDEPQPSAVKGLLIGVGLALLIIAAAAVAYFKLVKP